MNAPVIDPAKSDPFFGIRLDADGHVYPEPDRMAEILGDLGSDPIADYLKSYFNSKEDQESRTKNREQLWDIKGISALGASNPGERVEALDAMGMRCQLVYQKTLGKELRIDSPSAREASRRYNDFALGWAKGTGGRARAACLLNMGDRDW